MSDSITGQNQFDNQNYDAYGSSSTGSDTYTPSFGVFPSIQSHLVRAPDVAQSSHMSHARHLMDLLVAANQNDNQRRGPSLSLGSHILVPFNQYRPRSINPGVMNPNYFSSSEETQEACHPGVDHITNDYSFSNGTVGSYSTSLNRSFSTSYGTESFIAVVGNSRYLKPVQSLLKELVDVGGKVFDGIDEYYMSKLSPGPGDRKGAVRLSSELKAELRSNGFLSAENHELKVKITKLIALLDEVEARNEKYYHQMEEVGSSFEMIAGVGAAKCYTALALQAMSSHFCRLRDAILSQINVEKRKILQDLLKMGTGLSQLSLFDRENRYSRMSLQQLGMIQSQRQAWRPIRGLPETSVAILRSWLLEHFLHPYPNDSEKLMLASQTGLTKNQVLNWFINARVRLWKPMIEEMYKEEFGDSSEDSNLSSSNSLTREGIVEHVED